MIIMKLEGTFRRWQRLSRECKRARRGLRRIASGAHKACVLRELQYAVSTLRSQAGAARFWTRIGSTLRLRAAKREITFAVQRLELFNEAEGRLANRVREQKRAALHDWAAMVHGLIAIKTLLFDRSTASNRDILLSSFATWHRVVRTTRHDREESDRRDARIARIHTRLHAYDKLARGRRTMRQWALYAQRRAHARLYRESRWVEHVLFLYLIVTEYLTILIYCF